MAALRVHSRVPERRSAQKQNRENNPMQSGTGPGSQHSGRLRPGHEMGRRHGPS
jgi:hypothetical protein